MFGFNFPLMQLNGKTIPITIVFLTWASIILAFLFSRDQKAFDHFLHSLSFGGGAISQVNVHLFIETMPFGGVGNSRIGNYHGKYGFDSLEPPSPHYS